MPELPEVETVKGKLRSKILNKKITNVKFLYEKILETPSVFAATNMMIGQSVVDVKRRGKWLTIILNEYALLVHLRMEGKFIFRKIDDKIEKHEHVIIEFDDGISLRFQDVRKFAKMHLLSIDEYLNQPPLSELGMEPFDENLTCDYLNNIFKTKKMPIKTILLDQTIIAGIGNIYANEILFLSKLHPLRISNKLTKDEIADIIKNTRNVLRSAIEKGGTTIRSYTSEEGVTGEFQHELFVHGNDKKPCPVCKTTIEKIRVGGRGTYYCSNCQK